MTWWSWVLVGVLVGLVLPPAASLLWELWAASRDPSVPENLVQQARDSWGLKK